MHRKFGGLEETNRNGKGNGKEMGEERKEEKEIKLSKMAVPIYGANT